MEINKIISFIITIIILLAAMFFAYKIGYEQGVEYEEEQEVVIVKCYDSDDKLTFTYNPKFITEIEISRDIRNKIKYCNYIYN